MKEKVQRLCRIEFLHLPAETFYPVRKLFRWKMQEPQPKQNAKMLIRQPAD